MRENPDAKGEKTSEDGLRKPERAQGDGVYERQHVSWPHIPLTCPLRPHSELSNENFPTCDRPTNTISGYPSAESQLKLE
jgi:hypothetical protein